MSARMLYDFHHTTNAKKPGTVHATYLLTGILHTDTQPPSQPTHSLRPQDEDTPMESSPFPSSLPDAEPGPSFESEDAEPADEPVHNTTVLLVREEEIEEAKAEFEELQTIFMYSLEPGPLKDFQLLAQCNREVTKEFWTEDPLEAYPKYGLITNKDVRRRTGKRPPPPPAASTQPAKAAATASAKASQPAAATSVKEEDKPVPDPAGRSAPPAKPTASLKRQSSDLFKSFAKSKPPKLKTADSNATSASASANQSPVDREDAEMQGMSEDEDDEPPEEVDEEAAAKEAEKLAEARKARKEREEKLRAMMDEDDEDEEMADAGAETPAEEADKDEGALDPPQEPEKTEEVTVSDGRRRGRRKVMKKRTYKDEDGYLGESSGAYYTQPRRMLILCDTVTKEEAAWESFSEDEPEPKKPKMAPVQVKKKAGPAPKGQGSLMNFFKKK